MSAIIDPESAKSLIKEYQQQNSSVGGAGIKTTEDQFLNGYFLDRKSLEAILCNPKAEGISLHLAKHPKSKGSPSNHFTVLYAGAEPNPAPSPTTPYVNTGDIYGDTPPCPPLCGKIQ